MIIESSLNFAVKSRRGDINFSNAVVDVYTNDRRSGMFHIQLLVLEFEDSVRLNAYTNNGAKKDWLCTVSITAGNKKYMQKLGIRKSNRL